MHLPVSLLLYWRVGVLAFGIFNTFENKHGPKKMSVARVGVFQLPKNATVEVDLIAESLHNLTWNAAREKG